MKFQVSQTLKIRTPQGEINLHPGQVLDLPETKAEPLLKTGKVIPLGPDVSRPVTPKDFQGLFERADLMAVYKPGTHEMIREDFPDLAGEIQDTEDRVNLLWLQAREGEADMGAFREAVDRWKTLHLRAIRFFSLIQGVN